MPTLSRPTAILTSVNFDFGGGELHHVCSNCGSMFSREDPTSEIEEHLSGCEQMIPPFVWELTESTEDESDESTEDESDKLYELTCNGRPILVGTLDHFPDFEKLSEWQVTPFELVTEEYIYKYDFQNHLGDSLEFLLGDIGELREQVSGNRDIVERGSRYLSASRAGEYKAALAKLDAAVASAREAAESIKSMNAT